MGLFAGFHGGENNSVAVMAHEILYSDKYCDETHEYRHVTLPKELSKLIPSERLMTETEWRNLGIHQSLGWVHYLIHDPEPHVLLFKRPRTDLPKSTNSQTSELESGPKSIAVNN